MTSIYLQIADLLRATTLPGALGGFVWFLAGIRMGQLRNNHFRRKCALEVVGGGITASYITFPFLPLPQHTIAFLIGIGWAAIVQKCRTAITLEAASLLRGTKVTGPQSAQEGHDNEI